MVEHVAVEYADERLRIHGRDGLLLVGWYDAPTLAQVQVLERCGQALADATGGPIGMLDLVLAGKPAFKDEVRAAVASLHARASWCGHGVAHVVLLDGFAGVAVRAFFHTVLLLGRPKIRTKVFSDLGIAAEWLALGTPMRPLDILAAADTFIAA